MVSSTSREASRRAFSGLDAGLPGESVSFKKLLSLGLCPMLSGNAVVRPGRA
jgi:hypothetical protein